MSWSGAVLGYKRTSEGWNADRVFPVAAAKYPQPPDFVGVTRTYSKDVDEVVLRGQSGPGRVDTDEVQGQD